MCLRLVNFLTLFGTSLLLSGCSFAPFSSTQSAHTIEEDALAIQGGMASLPEIPYVRMSYGMTENLELGLLSEFHFSDVVSGVVAKYAFLNNKEAGASFSVETSVGGGSSSSYAYIAPIFGYKKDKWDSYIAARYNYTHVGYDDLELDFGWFGKIDLSGKTNLNYGIATVGNTYWMKKNFGVNVNANYAFGDFEGVYAGVGLVYVFK